MLVRFSYLGALLMTHLVEIWSEIDRRSTRQLDVTALVVITVRNHINMHKLVYGMRCYPHRTARKSIFVGCAGLSLSGTHISESEYNS